MQAQFFILMALIVAAMANDSPDPKADRHLLVTTMQAPSAAGTTVSSTPTPSMRFRRSETDGEPTKSGQSPVPKPLADEHVQPGSVKSPS